MPHAHSHDHGHHHGHSHGHAHSHGPATPHPAQAAPWSILRTTGLFGGMGKAEKAKIAQALAAVGLNGFENRSIGTLSGGQMQRMLFARVLLQDARLIVLDEPFNAIDAKTSADLLALVRRWHSEKRTVLAALHDLDLVRANFPET